MLSAMDSVKPAPDAETAQPRLWRNWYQAIIDSDPNFIPRRAGEEFPGGSTYATREEAEEAHYAWTETRRAIWDATDQAERGEVAIYLGARQDGDG